MADEIKDALAVIVQARDEAAAPLVFTAEAKAASDQRSEGQFRANLKLVPGGFASVKDGLINASRLFGEAAKALARFHDPNATEITLAEMDAARTFAERHCKLKIAGLKNKAVDEVGPLDGLVC